MLGDSKNETNYLKHKLWLSIVDSVNRVRFLLLFFYFVREYVICSVPDSDPDADADADPAIFVFDLQNASKKQMFLHNFFSLLHFEGTFTLFFEDKKSKRVTK